MNNELRRELKTLNKKDLKILIENIYVFCSREYDKYIPEYIFNEIEMINKLKNGLTWEILQEERRRNE